jgi:hypothetical protein
MKVYYLLSRDVKLYKTIVQKTETRVFTSTMYTFIVQHMHYLNDKHNLHESEIQILRIQV